MLFISMKKGCRKELFTLAQIVGLTSLEGSVVCTLNIWILVCISAQTHMASAVHQRIFDYMLTNTLDLLMCLTLVSREWALSYIVLLCCTVLSRENYSGSSCY